MGGTVLRTTRRRDWVKFHSEKHEESREEKYPTLLAHLTNSECTAGSKTFSLNLGTLRQASSRGHHKGNTCPHVPWKWKRLVPSSTLLGKKLPADGDELPRLSRAAGSLKKLRLTL